MSFRSLLIFVLTLLLPSYESSFGTALVADEANDFDERIAPILAANCLSCHSDESAEAGLNLRRASDAFAGGDSGDAILPHDSAASLLWNRIESDEMPPDHSLSDEEKDLIKAWIDSGANWGTDPIDPFQYSSEQRAGYDWWSLQPLQPVEPPVSSSDWGHNEIDSFVLRRLQQTGLQPAEQADPKTLVRRVYFDLVGLPPSPDTVKAFVDNPTQAAWRELIDQLLDSPEYGERWAQHWLDVARFAESDGFEYNAPRRDAWYYRDWVIDAFNNDMRYDQFARMQIAGDLLYPNSRDGLAAVGFLVAGIHNTVIGQSEFMKTTNRQVELEEIAGTTAQSFLGLTVNCARCHDHKFDPISQIEYYQFISALDGVTHGSQLLQADLSSPDSRSIHRRLFELREQLHDSIISRGETTSESGNSIETLDPISANRENESYSLTFHASPTVWANESQATTSNDHLVLTVVRQDGTALAWERFYPGSWNEANRSQEFQPFSMDYVGDGSGDVRIRISSFPHDGRFGGALDQLRLQQADGEVLFDEDFDQFERSNNRGEQARTSLPVFWGISSDRWFPRGLNSIHAVEYQQNNLAVQLFSGGLDGERPAPTEHEQSLLDEIGQIENEVAETSLYTVVPQEPSPMHLFERGDARLRGRQVSPGGLSAVVNLDSNFELPADATDRERRLALADWMTAPDNSLFHRVAVNRIWHHHFGLGIVDTPNDFGFSGGRPSHPDLLDWLAIWFREQDYSVKSIHRLILTSATYQQSSKVDAHPSASRAETIDSENRLLWRQNSKRIDAEAFRDGLLFVSGELNPQKSGPGFFDTRIETIGAAHYYRAIDPLGDSFNRRTIYRFRARGERSAILETFDCPDPSVTSPRRTQTTTASQALTQWNDAFVLRVAKALADRVHQSVQTEDTPDSAADYHDRIINQTWWFVLSRPPSIEELELSRQIVDDHSLELLCRVLLNSNELILVD